MLSWPQRINMDIPPILFCEIENNEGPARVHPERVFFTMSKIFRCVCLVCAAAAFLVDNPLPEVGMIVSGMASGCSWTLGSLLQSRDQRVIRRIHGIYSERIPLLAGRRVDRAPVINAEPLNLV